MSPCAYCHEQATEPRIAQGVTFCSTNCAARWLADERQAS